MALEITRRDADGVYVLDGELDLLTVRDLDEVVSNDGGDDGELILDIEGLRFIDSSGLRTLIRIAHERPEDRPLVLRRPSSSAKRILDIAFGDGGVPGMRIAS
jgi:anti-anti-sigma factor